MITLGTGANGQPAYNTKLFYLDDQKDLSNLKVECAVGSRAYIIENSKLYMKNSRNEWVEQKVTSGSAIDPTPTGKNSWNNMQGVPEK